MPENTGKLRKYTSNFEFSLEIAYEINNM